MSIQAPDGTYDALITGDETIVDASWDTYPPTYARVRAVAHCPRMALHSARHAHRYGIKNSNPVLSAHFGWSSSVSEPTAAPRRRALWMTRRAV
jgi:hypothetical protein